MQKRILTDRSGEPQDTTKNSLVIAATKLFAKQGYHGTSIADITNACSLTKSSFFHHFASKELVAIAVIDYLTYLAQRIFTPIHDNQLNNQEKISKLLDNLERFLLSEEEPLRAFFNIELILRSNIAKERVKSYSALWIDELNHAIQAYLHHHPRQLAEHSLACIYGYILTQHITEKTSAAKTCCNYLHRLWTSNNEIKILETSA